MIEILSFFFLVSIFKYFWDLAYFVMQGKSYMTLANRYIWYHQAFFAVIDGHGGHAAADFVAENLGRNITKALEYVGEEEGWLEQAIRSGYMVTDKEFLCQV